MNKIACVCVRACVRIGRFTVNCSPYEQVNKPNAAAATATWMLRIMLPSKANFIYIAGFCKILNHNFYSNCDRLFLFSFLKFIMHKIN